MAIDPSWKQELSEEFRKPYFKALAAYVEKARETTTVYPPPDQVLTAFKATPFDSVKVVILGQDPYHGPGQAHGLSFSVLPGTKVPPSLDNIYRELSADVGAIRPKHGYLMSWAQQGVFLLNSILTVEQGQAGSHANIGWETFTDQVLRRLNAREQPVVFILWGSHAKSKLPLLDPQRHAIIASAHPSPLSAHLGFFGSKPFSQTNDYLHAMGEPPIDWQLPRDQG